LLSLILALAFTRSGLDLYMFVFLDLIVSLPEHSLMSGCVLQDHLEAVIYQTKSDMVPSQFFSRWVGS
jgi:hypothetical protein